MKNLLFLLLISACSIQLTNAQSQWQRTIGGTGDEHAYSILQTTDGGFLVSGYTNSFGAGNLDFYFVKLNSIGIPQWTKTIGGTSEEMCLSVIKTTDGGYISTGHTRPVGFDYSDFYIVKLDSAFSIQWNKSINRASYDYSFSVVQLNDGGYVVSGLSATGGVFSSDMFIVKLTSTGN